MRQHLDRLTIRAPGQGLHDISNGVLLLLSEAGVSTGLLTLFCRHTSCSLLIQENAAPAARRDLERYFSRIAPESAEYEHDNEGPDDMPAHLRAALTPTQLSIPIENGKMLLGTWQGIYLFEHRRDPPEREIVLHLIGD